MKLTETFGAYLPISEEERKTLWEKAIVVFDANVLLQLYRYGPNTRKEVIDLLSDRLSKRVWLPYHVALEFFRNRPKLIDEDARRVSDLEMRIIKWVADLSSMVEESRLYELGVLSDSKQLADLANGAVESLRNELQKVRGEYPDLKSYDSVVNFVATLVQDSIGRPPDQIQVTEWDKLAQDRYLRKMPPGFEDAKTKNGEFVDRNVTYFGANGDVYVWLQLLHAVVESRERFEAVIFVTNDQKKDWWEIASGKVSGPRVELKQEITEAGARFFHMYTLSQFLEHLKAAPGDARNISAATLDEVRSSERTRTTFDLLSVQELVNAVESRIPLSEHDSKRPSISWSESAEFSVLTWLSTVHRDSIIINRGSEFPGIIARSHSTFREIGYTVIATTNLGSVSLRASRAIDKGLIWQRSQLMAPLEARRFGLVLVLSINVMSTRSQHSELTTQMLRCAATAAQAGVELRAGYTDGDVFIEIPVARLIDWDKLSDEH